MWGGFFQKKAGFFSSWEGEGNFLFFKEYTPCYKVDIHFHVKWDKLSINTGQSEEGRSRYQSRKVYTFGVYHPHPQAKHKYL